jgi:hypothetical protein
MKHGKDMSTAKACNMPWCAHDNEYSNAIANRGNRCDVLDSRNGQGNLDEGVGPGNGSAPGSDMPSTGDENGIPIGMD